MNNQVLLWGLFFLPWLVVFFMKKENVKRYMPAALLAVISSELIVQVGEVLKWWVFKEYAYPLHSPSYIYSLNPIITIIIFRYTYGRFWLFLVTDAISNLAFSYIYLGYFLVKRGILEYLKLGPFSVFIITTVTAILLYVYQKWQEDIFVTDK
jgi:hypothetical protein